MSSTREYFERLEKCNGFPYDPCIEAEEQFELLADWMNWSGKAYRRQKSKFLNILSSEEVFDIHNFHSMQEYFDYFSRNHGFEASDLDDLNLAFRELAKYMKWSGRHSYEYNKIRRIQHIRNQKQYVRGLFQRQEMMDYSDRVTPLDNFLRLSRAMRWNKYQEERNKFDRLVGQIAQRRLSNLDELHDIIRDYGLLEFLDGELPNSIGKCRKFLKANLFVNIYDFIAENTTQFQSLAELRRYSWETDQIYPLADAKEDEVLKVLLHPIRRGDF